MRTYHFKDLERLAARLFEAAGVPASAARRVAESLVLSNRLGHHSHGVLRIPYYLQLIQAGKLDPHGSIEVVRETTSTALIDGHRGFGQLVAKDAVLCAVAKARESYVAAVGVYHLNHVGRVGEYTEMAAEEKMIALAFCGGVGQGNTPNVAPYGGAKAVWGTNPIAIAIPTGDAPFSLDFATSVIAGGKTAVARAKGVELPAGLVIDSEGRATTDPSAVLRGGAILPFGGHKGYGLAFVVELLAGALVGAAAPELSNHEMDTGLLFIVVNPAAFRSIGSFEGATGEVFRSVKECPPGEGFEEVLIPGEPERRQRMLSDEAGVSLPDSVWQQLDKLGQDFGLTPLI